MTPQPDLAVLQLSHHRLEGGPSTPSTASAGTSSSRAKFTRIVYNPRSCSHVVILLQPHLLSRRRRNLVTAHAVAEQPMSFSAPVRSLAVSRQACHASLAVGPTFIARHYPPIAEAGGWRVAQKPDSTSGRTRWAGGAPEVLATAPSAHHGGRPWCRGQGLRRELPQLG